MVRSHFVWVDVSRISRNCRDPAGNAGRGRWTAIRWNVGDVSLPALWP